MMLKKFNHGFTLVELIVILLVIGILAAIAVPKLNIEGFRERGFVQQSLAAIRYAQKQAIASGCEVQVTINTSGCNLQLQTGGVSCSATAPIALDNPVTGSTNFCAESQPPVANDLPKTFVFDNIGKPDAGGALQLGDTTIGIEAETGYAHEI